MEHRQAKWVWRIAILAAILMMPTPSSGARVRPSPLLVQFESGYGVVAAQVVSETRVSKVDEYPGVLDVVFKVDSVVAQPIEGVPFPLRTGDGISVRLTVGYACQIENQSIDPGQRFFLTLKRQPGGGYLHADGASAPRAVDGFVRSEMDLYAKARQLATVPKAQRLKAWLACVQNPSASQDLRQVAMDGLQGRMLRGDGVDPAEARQISAALRRTWNDPSANLSINSLEQLDYLLRVTDGKFDETPDRAIGWLVHLFAPTPDLRKDDNDRDNLAYQILRGLMVTQPEIVGQRLAVEMFDQNWPPMYRRAISAALMSGYCNVTPPDASWEPALQKYYADGLRVETDSFALRMMAVDINGGLSIPNSARQFVASDAVRAALTLAIARLSVMGHTNPADAEAGVAIMDCKATLDALSKVKAKR